MKKTIKAFCGEGKSYKLDSASVTRLTHLANKKGLEIKFSSREKYRAFVSNKFLDKVKTADEINPIVALEKDIKIMLQNLANTSKPLSHELKGIKNLKEKISKLEKLIDTISIKRKHLKEILNKKI